MTTTYVTKECRHCKQLLPLTDFWRNSASKDRHQNICITCESGLAVHKRTPPEKRIHKIHVYHGKGDTIQDRFDYLMKSKEGKPCECCGNYEHPKCYDYHHVDESTKSFQLSAIKKLGSKINMELLKAEIAKCILVCNSCHRKIHLGLVTILKRENER